ncbi:MAG: hypothetical protein WC700_16890 [Gemmatimonadaceae bacterium]|jgi:hypothetical protein
MSTSVKFLKAEAGKQTAFGTPAAPTFKLPFVGEYADAQEEHVAEWDAGYWTPTAIVEKTADMATISLSGAMFFELLPVFLSAGFADLSPGGAGPYAYDYEIDPAAVGAPSPYTFLLGGNEALGATGPAVKIQDAYLRTMSLSFSISNRQVTAQSEWFGLSVNDNGAAGFAFIGAALPTTPGMMKGLLSALEIQDAATTGSDFTTMTAFDCSLLDWTLSIDTGLRPKWAADENALTYCGYYHEAPVVTFTPTIRTNSVNYALVKAKANARTHQELLLTMNGAASRQVKWMMTGRWLPGFTAHGRANNEVVMQPTFQCETPYTQVTTPHFFGWELDTLWSHT